ncbi:MAG: hypothetical protein K2Q06_01275 [Parvularculaceae bacterium]|nr:hypothetical protein [Parvularculaceae bacterium]
MMFPADDPVTDDPRPTALFQATASASVANSWTSVNGWSVARVYSTVDEEYEAAQTSAAVADLGAVIRYTAQGKDAAAVLARATTAPVEGLIPGESARGLMLDDGGAVVDLVEAARLGGDFYLLCTTRPHARRLQLAARGFEATVTDVTARVAALAILGPDARAAAAAAGLDSASELLGKQGKVRGVETSSRPIHFGTLPGIELIFPFEEALTIWERLRRAKAPRPIGLDALEVFRIESGAPRPGVDFALADETADRSLRRLPEVIGLTHLAPADRAWFNGRRGMTTASRSGRRLVVAAVDGPAVAPGAAVFSGKKGVVGRVTSSAWSPRLRRAICFAEILREAVGRPLEIATAPAEEARVGSALFETPEARLAGASSAGVAARR